MDVLGERGEKERWREGCKRGRALKGENGVGSHCVVVRGGEMGTSRAWRRSARVVNCGTLKLR